MIALRQERGIIGVWLVVNADKKAVAVYLEANNQSLNNFALEVKHKSIMKLWPGLVYMAQATAVVPPAHSYAAMSKLKGQMKRLFYEIIRFIHDETPCGYKYGIITVRRARAALARRSESVQHNSARRRVWNPRAGRRRVHLRRRRQPRVGVLTPTPRLEKAAQ